MAICAVRVSCSKKDVSFPFLVTVLVGLLAPALLARMSAEGRDMNFQPDDV